MIKNRFRKKTEIQEHYVNCNNYYTSIPFSVAMHIPAVIIIINSAELS